MIENNSVHIKMYDCKENKKIDIPIEDILKQIIAYQIDVNFHIEAIKAQAIIARTQLIRNSRAFGGDGCTKHQGSDICNEGHCFGMNDLSQLKELWKDDYQSNLEKLNTAITETEGLIITINNKPIYAKYHHTCGGATENSENILGNKIVYLRKVLCDYCKDSPNWEGYKDFTLEEIEEKLNIKFPKITPTFQSEVKGFIDGIERDEEGRITALRIGSKEFKGTELVGLLDLDSTRFSITPLSIRFTMGGKGDGLGLCQHGAHQMAMEGFDFNEIINYYFTGIEISKIQKPCIKKPLNGRLIVIDPGHGGEDSKDSVGITGLREKDVVLSIGLGLKDKLEELGGKIYLTREKDEYLSLSKRADYANEIRPDFFISLHLNSFSNPSIQGCEVYHYRNDKNSQDLGRSIINSLVLNLGSLDKGIRNADFFLLREVGVSALQLEIDYITNPEQEKKLSEKSYIDRVVDAISEGIVDYYRY